MINALVYGCLVNCREAGNQLVGRIATEGDVPVQFTARRGFVKRALSGLAQGMPVSVAGQLELSIRYDKSGSPYILRELTVSAVLTAQPRRWLGLFKRNHHETDR